VSAFGLLFGCSLPSSFPLYFFVLLRLRISSCEVVAGLPVPLFRSILPLSGLACTGFFCFPFCLLLFVLGGICMYKCLTGTLEGRYGAIHDTHEQRRHATHEVTKLRPIRGYEVTTITNFLFFFLNHYHHDGLFSYHILVRQRTNINHHDCCRLACPIHFFFCCRPRPPKFSCWGVDLLSVVLLFALIKKFPLLHLHG